MGPLEVIEVFVFFVLPAACGYKLGLRLRHEVMGLVLGLVLSWLGVLIVALLPKPADPLAG